MDRLSSRRRANGRARHGPLVQWIGLGILAAITVLCVLLAVSYARGARERTGIPRWVIAETYAVGAVAALAGLVWLS